MNASRPKPAGDTAPALGPIRVQKRDSEPSQSLREKLCADCGRSFALEAEQKYFLCPACYKKRFARKPVRKGETQILIQIQCIECGVTDYLDFMPSDPTKATCKACFHRRKREPTTESPHTT